MTRPSDASDSRRWRPSLWLRTLTAAGPAAWPAGRSVRAAVGVAGPMLVAALTGHLLVGMWVSMGTLLLTAGEKSVGYGTRFRQIATTTPLASAAYFLGALSHAAPVVTVAVMAVVALVSGLLSGYSGILSVATMQAMLIAAIAIGVPAAAPYWKAAGLFVVGALLYAALLLAEAATDRRRPQRHALVAVLERLADLARAQAAGATDLTAARAHAVAAIDAFDRLAITSRRAAAGPSREYSRAATVSRAADQLLARLLAHDAEPALSAAAADRLTEMSRAAAHRRRPTPSGIDDGTLVRVRMLESAIWDRTDLFDALPRPERARLSLPGPALLASAGRLSLCTALAYAAFYLLPVPHGYWIPLTVALVMKPDLGSVFGRAVLRSIGTVCGAAIAVALGLLPHDPMLASALLAVLAACLPWAMARSYLWQAMFLTPLIMILIDVVVPADTIPGISLARIESTFLGGAIVVVAGYLIWPSARHTGVGSAFGAALSSLARYAKDVAAGQSAAVTSADRQDAYRRLSDTRVHLQRSLSEPPPAGTEACAWIPVVDAAERVADRITSASASRTPPGASPDASALTALADELAAFDRCTAMAHDRPTRTPTPPAHGDRSTDPAVRELADEIAHLQSMLVRRSPAGAAAQAGRAPRGVTERARPV